MNGTAALMRKLEHVLYKLYPISNLRFVKLMNMTVAFIVLFCIMLCNKNAFRNSGTLCNKDSFCGIMPVLDINEESWKILPGQKLVRFKVTNLPSGMYTSRCSHVWISKDVNL